MGFYIYAVRCPNPLGEIMTEDSSVSIADQELDVFLEGANVTLICPPGQMFNGPNALMCMGNGEWEPDLNNRRITCKGALFNFLYEINIYFKTV